jgi:putative transposase
VESPGDKTTPRRLNMGKKRHTPDQIITILKQSEAGVKTSDLCRQNGISEATLYNWKAKYGGLEVSDIMRLKSLEDENRRLKQIVADQTLDIQALKGVLSKKF